VEPARKQRLAWVAFALLATLSLGSLAGSTVLLERRAAESKRVPSPIIKSWKDAQGNAIAIVNTDTVAGSFLVEFEAPNRPRLHFASEVVLREGFRMRAGERPRGGESRVSVPARSIVLRSDPRLANWEYTVWLYGPSGSIGCFEDYYFRRAVPRGTRVTLAWERYENEGNWTDDSPPDEFYLTESDTAALKLVAQPGVAFASLRQSGIEGPWFKWDGKTPVALDIDTTTPPELIHVFGVACMRGKGSVGHSEHVWAYPEDMTVIDERDVAGK
jgi:hypothetical protein